MFKDFSSFNRLADLCFTDEKYDLILAAFRQFQSLNSLLRTEAYDYATWYNKIMRDKYEDGEPVDVTDLPYLSVPRSQLAMMRARLRKTHEACDYAAQAISEIALGAKMSNPRRFSDTATSANISPSISSSDRQAILAAILTCNLDLGPLSIVFEEGNQQISVNGISVGISPLITGALYLTKLKGQNSRLQTCDTRVSSWGICEVLRKQSPLVVCRSEADADPASLAPVAIKIASLPFFGKRILIWATSDSPYTIAFNLPLTGVDTRVFTSTVHAEIINAGEEKATIARSLYDPSSQDYADCISFNMGTTSDTSLYFDYPTSAMFGINNPGNSGSTEFGGGSAVFVSGAGSLSTGNISYSCADAKDVTTQTAIADLFHTPDEWQSLEDTLAEA